MTWTAIVLAPPEVDGGAMRSRLPSYLHPVAGRPLIWHTVNSLAIRGDPPREVIVAAMDLSVDLFDGVPAAVRIVEPSLSETNGIASGSSGNMVLVHPGASLDADGLRRLLASSGEVWIGDGNGVAAALLTESERLAAILDSPDPFAPASFSPAAERIAEKDGSFIVRTRADLARAQRAIRDQLLRSLMEGGVTFLLPESVLVDVAVRIGRDSIIYPGAVIEGQTTIGEETVVGPGCRIIDSWIGSGVELKGWNYLANTSVRNRAILEPYVRRGFD